MAITFSKNYNNETGSAIRGVYRYNSTADTYTLQTDTTTMDYFDDTAVAGDALIFRTRYDQYPLERISFNVGTPISATGLVLKWYVGGKVGKVNAGAYEYIDWVEVTSEVIDNTNGFTTSGTIELPRDQVVHGKFAPITTNARDRWVKCEIDSVTSITEGGAQQTARVSFGYNYCKITGSYKEGTLTSLSSYYRLYDTSTSFGDGVACRACWLPNSDDKWNKFPIRFGGTTYFDIGLPYAYSPSSFLCAIDTDNPPVAGDPYVISYTIEDIRLACEAAGYDWCKGIHWQPRSQDYKHYQLDCYISIDNISSTSGYTFLADFSKRVSFSGNYKMYGDTATADRSKCMFGTRAHGYNSKDGKYGPNDLLPVYGCTFDMVTNGVNGSTVVLIGDFAGCTWESGCRYSFVTYYYIYKSQFYNCTLGNCQISSGYQCDGQTLIHSPVAEPLRDPQADFNVKDFRAGGPVVYMVGGNAATLDSPASSDVRPFRSYAGFVGTDYCNVIDKEENTRKAVNWGAFVNPTGKFYFFYRVKIKCLDENNNPIDGVDVRVYNEAGELQYNHTTDADGISEDADNNQVLESSLIHDDQSASTAVSVEELFGPFKIILKKNGYESIIEYMDITRPEDLVFNMRASTNTRRV